MLKFQKIAFRRYRKKKNTGEECIDERLTRVILPVKGKIAGVTG